MGGAENVLAEGQRDIRRENKNAIQKGITNSKALNAYRRDEKNQIRERAREGRTASARGFISNAQHQLR